MKPLQHRRTTRGLGSFLLLLLFFVPIPTARAQIAPPAPGVQLPEAYRQRVREDRTAFHFKRAWKGVARRAREARRLQQLGLLPVNGAGIATVVAGTKTVPVIAGRFSNTPFDPYSVPDLQARLFDGPNPTGTITDYYTEISRGNLTLHGQVIGAGDSLFTVSQPDTYYESGCNGLCGTAKTGEYLKELLDGTDGGVDFGQFDNDGPDGLPNSGDDDGFVDFIAFVQPESGGECGNANLWSHRWVYEGWWGSPYVTNDPAAGGGFIKVSDYTIQPLLSCDGTSLIEIGVYTHEFGHAFGLPDLYDTNSNNGTSEGIGHWGLMASGSWGGDGSHPQTPSHMCAWSKEQLGWVTPQVVCASATGLGLNDVETTGEVLKVYPHGLTDTEYFLIENRTQTGFDAWLPTSGLAVWHIDNDQAGNGDETHKQVDLEEADGLAQMDAAVNRGDAGDLFPGSSGNTAFTDLTNPDAKDYAGAATGLAVTAIDGVTSPRGFDLAVSPCLLGITNVAVDDLPCGNNNGTLDSFERSDLRICLGNDFADPRTSVRAVLTSLTPGVTVLRDSVYYGTVAFGPEVCGGGTFEIEATTALAPGSSVDFQLDITGDAYSSSATFSLSAGNYVLIVEDDGAAANSSYYTNAVANAGFAYVLHDVSVSGTPTLGQLQGALAVVWYTGQAFENTVSPAEQAVLTTYLDGGGSLFLSGQDIGYDLSSQGNAADLAFYTDYLHATYLADDTNDLTLTGVTGDPIGDGMTLDLTGGANNSDFPSRIDPVGGSTSVFLYNSTWVGAVRYEAAFKSLYFAFNFESNLAADQDTLMARILAWQIAGDVVPPVATLTGPVGGETFSNCNPIPVTWTATDNVGVTVVDLLYSADSGATWQPIASGLSNTGSYAWDAGGLTGSNVRVKVKARDAAALQGVGTSASDFTIGPDAVQPAVTVVAPNGGEVIPVESAVTINWSAADSCSGIDSCRVWVSLNGGVDWSYVATTVAPDTSAVWAAPSTASDSCLVRVDCWDAAGNLGSDVSDSLFVLSGSPLAVDPSFTGATAPVLLQNYPNPFRAGTTFSFYLPEETDVTLRVFDLSGRLVRTVVEAAVGSGSHEARWDGRNAAGRPAVGGIYFYVLETPTRREVRKLVRVQ